MINGQARAPYLDLIVTMFTRRVLVVPTVYVRRKGRERGRDGDKVGWRRRMRMEMVLTRVEERGRVRRRTTREMIKNFYQIIKMIKLCSPINGGKIKKFGLFRNSNLNIW